MPSIIKIELKKSIGEILRIENNMITDIPEQTLNDLKTANQKIISIGLEFVSCKDILISLSSVNLKSYEIVSKYVEFNGKTFNPKLWFNLCDKAGI